MVCSENTAALIASYIAQGQLPHTVNTLTPFFYLITNGNLGSEIWKILGNFRLGLGPNYAPNQAHKNTGVYQYSQYFGTILSVIFFLLCIWYDYVNFVLTAEIGDFIIEEYHDHSYLSVLGPFVPNQTEEMLKKVSEYHKQHMYKLLSYSSQF